jgi:hypothetical protein
MWRWLVVLGLLVPVTLEAQAWDDPATRELVGRGVARRELAFADSSLRDWSARAHGFVFFLGQIGEGLAEPPRLVKADQLELEVYWRLPNQSKQRIVGWRDRRELPTDINYHRDHLGIAMNNFPDLIRLGEGDEVKDVPHPVSLGGMDLYEYALADSLTISMPDRVLRVYEVKFRPLDFRAPRIVGSLFFEVGTADLVRMSFSFTRSAYLDTQLEDITVSIENSLWGGRWWLPIRQELEIRRRATFLDFPARGIIRGRFEIDGYQFNQGLDPQIFTRWGPAEIVAAPPAVRDSFPWTDSLEAAIRDVAQPASMRDFDAVRAEAVAMAMGHVLSGLPQTQIAGGSLSDFLHVNRVEGVALGAGAAFRSADEARELRLHAGVGTATGLFTGSAALSARRGSTTWRLAGFREVRDLGDLPVISRAMNSILTQEGGRDYGDYYLAAGGSLGLTHALGGRSTLLLEGGYDRVDSLLTAGRWARGTFSRPNPGVDAGRWGALRLVLKRRTPSFAATSDVSGRIEAEGGGGTTSYGRVYGELRRQSRMGPGLLLLRLAAGYGTSELPRHRDFVLGGRGTLLGAPFRSLRGTRMTWGSVEWQIPVPFPEIHMGSFAGTGNRLTLAPNVAAGTLWTNGANEVSLGLGASWLHDLLRFDVGYGVRTKKAGFSVDVSRSFWDIL